MKQLSRRDFVKGSGALGLGLGMSSGSAHAEESVPVPEHIFLITLDTFRYDHMGCYGYPRATTPHLDRFAAEGARFEHAYSPISMTCPSHTSMFTSLYPLTHKVMSNRDVISESLYTLPAMLREEGYQALAFSAVGRFFGELDKHFDEYQTRVDKSIGSYISANQNVDNILARMADIDPTKKSFVWAHFYDPHLPLQPPEASFAELALDSKAREDALVDFYYGTHKIDQDFWGDFIVTKTNKKSSVGTGAPTQNMLHHMNLYDAEILNLDAQLGRLFAGLDSLGFDKNSAWVVVADHGEGLGNHSYYEHRSEINNEQLRIPLMFRFSNGFAKGRTIPGRASQLDLFPTLAALVGRDLGEKSEPMEGQSLLPLLSDEKAQLAERMLFAERWSDFRDTNNFMQATVKFAIQNSQYKYLHDARRPNRTDSEEEIVRDALFDIASDPYETNNLWEAHREGLGWEMKRAFFEKLKYLRSFDLGVERTEVDSPEVLQDLEALGYL